MEDLVITQLNPQPGFQEKFLSSSADIVFGGGAAGAGKSFALLLEAVRNYNVKGYTGTIFRRTRPQITNGGGLRDTSAFYRGLGGVPTESSLTWRFPGGGKVKMTHLEHEKNKYDHQGAQYPFIGFDEITHFSKTQFIYLMSRNRSDCGVSPYIRATCNPDPDSWVANMIERWIGEDGYIIKERDGVIRYFTVDQDNFIWGSTKEEVAKKVPNIKKQAQDAGIDWKHYIKSFTFIEGSIYDNKKLLETDPGYLAGLNAQTENEKLRLLFGNWKIRTDGMSLGDYNAINDIFSNFLKQEEPKRYITVDVARFGRDLAVVKVREGRKVVKIKIRKKSSIDSLYNEIEVERESYNIQKSHVLVDQDGVGGGVVDMGGYIGFSGGSSTFEDPGTEIKENYANLKTQCAYRFFDKVNNGEVSITDENIYVDGIKTREVKIGSKILDVLDLIKQDLRSFKRKDPDKDGKKKIIPKEQQKSLLNGRSPDFGDTCIMRVYFDIAPTEPEPAVYFL